MSVSQRLDESNKGHQLLKAMGWGGAGLGSKEQGIAEPISGGEVGEQYSGRLADRTDSLALSGDGYEAGRERALWHCVFFTFA